MLFWGTILSSTLRAGPSTSEVKRHKVLSTSKSLALFCSGLVILLANEASEAISEYRVVPVRCSRGGALQRAETTCAGGCSSLKSSRRRRRAVPATLMRRRTFVQRRSANSFSIYYRSSSLHQRRRRRRGARAAYMSRAYLHSSVQLSLLFSSPTMTTYTNATSVCPRLYATRTYKRRRRRHTDCHIHIRTYIVATRQVSTAVIR